jgi:hypothetical protein
MTTLLAAPYSLIQGSLILVEVQAQNRNGWGVNSVPNSSGIVIQVVPYVMGTPTKGASTSDTQI